ncbi:hypothetical protein CERZMDRAFT_102878 [Cercospora zeae-maydis SCOH1-5]|uniref:Uncharacterized protein n=1 Tax=Cercospora zeae-maydis SCOH1-5 TaxID=717836 RepID=A0A6A6F0Y7_9PEZI|nr:hypothetical protein CERZMDRAFT_102878 [Cercospora zeae-maydis SCOH1-5]
MSPDLPTLISLAHLGVIRLPRDDVMWDFVWYFFFKEEGRCSPTAALGIESVIIILATAAYQATLERPMIGYTQEWAYPYGYLGKQRAAGEHLVNIFSK